MIRFLVHWLALALALFIASSIVPGIRVSSTPALFVAAFVLGFVNAVIKPVLVVLTLPITVVTLGLFYLVVNGFALALTAWLVPGLEVTSFGQAVLGAIVISLASWFIGLFLGQGRERGRE